MSEFILTDEYIRVLQEIVATQYDEDQEEFIPVLAPAEPEFIPPPKPLVTINRHLSADVTNMKRSEIKKIVTTRMNIKVDSFSIIIKRYNGDLTQPDITVDIDVRELRTKTPTGRPCSIEYKCDLTKDNRFNTRPWITFFRENNGINIPLDTLVDIIRWIQAVRKLPAFL